MNTNLLTDPGLITLVLNPTRLVSPAAVVVFITSVAVIFAGTALHHLILLLFRTKNPPSSTLNNYSSGDDVSDDSDDDVSSDLSDDDVSNDPSEVSSESGDRTSESGGRWPAGEFDWDGDVVKRWDGFGLGLGFDVVSDKVSPAVVRRWRPENGDGEGFGVEDWFNGNGSGDFHSGNGIGSVVTWPLVCNGNSSGLMGSGQFCHNGNDSGCYRNGNGSNRWSVAAWRLCRNGINTVPILLGSLIDEKYE